MKNLDLKNLSLGTTAGLFFACWVMATFVFLLTSLVSATRQISFLQQIVAPKSPNSPVPSSQLSLPNSIAPQPSFGSDPTLGIQWVRAKTSQDLIDKLKQFSLWDIPAHSAIPPIVIDHFPKNSSKNTVQTKKKIFLYTVLPVALIVHNEIMSEKKALNYILGKIAHPIDQVSEANDWQHGLQSQEIAFLLNLVKKYRTNEINELLTRIDIIPTSLILAQSALESSWGSSRFAVEGNNLFGIWTWKEDGLVPFNRDPGKSHKVAIYPSIIDSVRAYCLLINTNNSYNDFRTIRKTTLDPDLLADGLSKYSEKRLEYINDLKTVIRVNKLRTYDTYYLGSIPRTDKSLEKGG